MAENQYVIAELPLSIQTDDRGFMDYFSAFAASGGQEPALVADMQREPILEKLPGEIVLEDSFKWVRLSDKPYHLGIYIQRGDGSIHAVMEVDRDWSRARIQYLLDRNIWKWKSTLALWEILFRNCLLFNQGIVIHASAIEWEGKGIVFTAPAGTGKTTQANLWKTYFGARVINGDRPALRVLADQLYVFGTPWSGSSKEYLNVKAPVAALVIIEQARENSVVRLTAHEALQKIMPRFFLPFIDQKMMELAMNTIERILVLAPLYLLRCRPDREAAETLCSAVNNK